MARLTKLSAPKPDYQSTPENSDLRGFAKASELLFWRRFPRHPEDC
jgi:hypothetical protein